MGQTEQFANNVEVRSGRRLFVRKVALRGAESQDPLLQIVAVHGTCASQLQFQALLDALGDQGISADVILYDCLGLAQSPIDTREARDYVNEEHSLDFEAIVDRFTATDLPTFLMGHSYGPTHIFNYLSKNEASFSNKAGLILIGSAVRSEHLVQSDGGHPIFKLPLPILNCMQSYLTESFIKLSVHPDNLESIQAALRGENNRNDMAVARAYHTNMQWPAAEIAAHAASKLPTLIIHGAQDHIIPVECGQHLHNTMGGSTLVVIEKAGHLVHVEQAERVATEITTFLTQHATTSR